MIYHSTMTLPGVKLDAESSLPILRDREIHRTFENENLPEHIAKKLGHHCGYRVLPYKLQNHYHRQKKLIDLKTIVLENDILKATFLPEYGGRLYSLYNKHLQRELLSVNPVFQPANLGLRNAWFSGGIEWNMAHFGHTYLSSDHVHFGKCVDGETEFIRLYEYERSKGLYYQIDFYLPDGSEHLLTYTKVFNPKEEEVPFYYWSNTAVSELNNARVFSDAEDVIYIKPYFNEKGEMINTFSYGQVPTLEGIEGDVSYPRNFKRSNEYFYQNKREIEYPFEAVGYEDGFLFYECSSQPLCYRKMFCWGTHKGGTKWQEYLSEANGDKYVEIQAGVYPSQLHSETLKGQTEIRFMQVFGGSYVEEKSALYKELNRSTAYVKSHIFSNLSKEKLREIEEKMRHNSGLGIDEILHEGHPYGWLDQTRLRLENKDISLRSMTFNENLNHESSVLVSILRGEAIDIDMRKDSVPFIVEPSWSKYLESYEHEYTYLLLALINSEQGQLNKGIKLLENYLKEDYSSIYFRTLGAMYLQSNQHDEALAYYKMAYQKMNEMAIKYYKEDFLSEYLGVLNRVGAYRIAYDIFEENKDLNHEEFLVEACKAAYQLGKYEVALSFMNLEFERIREGDTTMIEIWYQIKAAALDQPVEYIKKHYEAPNNIDFRML